MTSAKEAQNAVVEKQFPDELKSYLEVRMYSMIREEIAHEEEQRFRQIKWIIAIVGLIGVGTFGTLANYFIGVAVDSRLEQRAGQISDALEFVKFQALANKLELGTSFSQDERDAIMTYLRSISNKDTKRHSSEFLGALQQITSAFASANQSASLDEIYHLYSQEILSRPVLVQSLLHHYGQEIVSRQDIPKIDDTAYKTFEQLERLSQSSNVGELALFYRVLYQFRSKGERHSDDVANDLMSLSTYEKSDVVRFLSELFQRSKVGNWQTEATPGGYAFEKITRAFLSTYRAEFAKLFKVNTAIIDEISADGLDENQVKPMAITLVNQM